MSACGNTVRVKSPKKKNRPVRTRTSHDKTTTTSNMQSSDKDDTSTRFKYQHHQLSRPFPQPHLTNQCVPFNISGGQPAQFPNQSVHVPFPTPTSLGVNSSQPLNEFVNSATQQILTTVIPNSNLSKHNPYIHSASDNNTNVNLLGNSCSTQSTRVSQQITPPAYLTAPRVEKPGLPPLPPLSSDSIQSVTAAQCNQLPNISCSTNSNHQSLNIHKQNTNTGVNPSQQQFHNITPNNTSTAQSHVSINNNSNNKLAQSSSKQSSSLVLPNLNNNMKSNIQSIVNDSSATVNDQITCNANSVSNSQTQQLRQVSNAKLAVASKRIITTPLPHSSNSTQLNQQSAINNNISATINSMINKCNSILHSPPQQLLQSSNQDSSSLSQSNSSNIIQSKSQLSHDNNNKPPVSKISSICNNSVSDTNNNNTSQSSNNNNVNPISTNTEFQAQKPDLENVVQAHMLNDLQQMSKQPHFIIPPGINDQDLSMTITNPCTPHNFITDIVTVSQIEPKIECNPSIDVCSNTNNNKVSCNIFNFDSFHKKLFNLHFGSCEAHKIEEFMINKLNNISNIKQKIDEHQEVSMHEYMQYYNSQNYALIMSQISNTMSNISLHNHVLKIDKQCERYKLSVFIINAVYYEIWWFIKVYMSKFQTEYPNILKNMNQHPSSCVRTDAVTINKVNRNLKIQLPGDNKKQSLSKCWVDFLTNLIASDPNGLIDDLVQTLAKQQVLPNQSKWTNPNVCNNWRTTFIDIMDIHTYHQKAEFKNLFLILMAQSTQSLSSILAGAVQFLPSLRKSNAECHIWKFKPLWVANKFILTVWPSILKRHFNPIKFIHPRHFNNWLDLGAASYLFAWFGFCGIFGKKRHVDWSSRIQNFIPLQYYGLLGKFKSWHVPTCWNTDLINKFKYNAESNNDHWLNKITPLCLYYIMCWYENHYSDLQSLYGVGKCDNDIDFDSNILTKPPYDDSIQQIFQNYQIKRMNLSQDREMAVQRTSRNLHAAIFNLKSNPVSYKLTTYSQIHYCNRQSMYAQCLALLISKCLIHGMQCM